MHTLLFKFTNMHSTVAQDALVYAASIDLFVHNKIDCSQTSDCTLEFDTAQDCLFASIALSNRSSYTVHILS
jgi:hypothetical protein